jgi:hypothetical protein
LKEKIIIVDLLGLRFLFCISKMKRDIWGAEFLFAPFPTKNLSLVGLKFKSNYLLFRPDEASAAKRRDNNF